MLSFGPLLLVDLLNRLGNLPSHTEVIYDSFKMPFYFYVAFEYIFNYLNHIYSVFPNYLPVWPNNFQSYLLPGENKKHLPISAKYILWLAINLRIKRFYPKKSKTWCRETSNYRQTRVLTRRSQARVANARCSSFPHHSRLAQSPLHAQIWHAAAVSSVYLTPSGCGWWDS